MYQTTGRREMSSVFSRGQEWKAWQWQTYQSHFSVFGSVDCALVTGYLYIAGNLHGGSVFHSIRTSGWKQFIRLLLNYYPSPSTYSLAFIHLCYGERKCLIFYTFVRFFIRHSGPWKTSPAHPSLATPWWNFSASSPVQSHSSCSVAVFFLWPNPYFIMLDYSLHCALYILCTMLNILLTCSATLCIKDPLVSGPQYSLENYHSLSIPKPN